MSQQTTTQAPTRAAEPTLSDLVDHLTRFDGPPDQFLLHLLMVQCHIGGAEGGVMLRTRAAEPEVLAVYPPAQPNQTAPVWLAQAVESAARVVQAGETIVLPLRTAEDFYEETPSQSLMMIPLRTGGGVRGVVAFVIPSVIPTVLRESRTRLELSTSLLSLYEMRLTMQRRQSDLQRLRQGMEVLSSINENAKFQAAAMAFCNEIASAWQADRVSLGFLKGRYVKAAAMSHTEKFTRKMKLVLDIEAAMEECIDQDVEVIHPAQADATYVSRATGELANRHGPNTVCNLPLRQGQKTIGVLTVERAVDKPFQLEEIESLRLVSDLCTARLADLHENDKWIGAKIAADARKGLAVLVGPEHTWLKVAAIVLFAAIVFFTFAKGTNWAEGSFVIETIELRKVPAPFAGFLDEVFVEENAVVNVGDPLATLDIRDLDKQRLQLEAARGGALTEFNRAQADADIDPTKLADRDVAQSRLRQIDAQLGLVNLHLQQAVITAPMAGIVVRDNDLKKNQGGPVEQGQVLFEIAPLDSLRAEIQVPENRIKDVKEEQTGELRPESHPGEYIEFEVEKITRYAEVINQRNVYRVRVRFTTGTQDFLNLLPGSEGVARIDTGDARYAWLWTRDLVNWVRMKLWW